MKSTVINPVRVAIIGTGVRGTSLARKLINSRYPAIIAGFAEPDPGKRMAFAREFNIAGEAVFTDWQELTGRLMNCDAAVIATLDNQHAGPTLACLERGWHVLTEKPLADNFEDCLRIIRKQEEMNKVIAVCHTLRFMEGFRKVREIVNAAIIGDIVHIEHMEGIGHFRFAHNYVRGRWAREENNTFLLLHKCSHDIDYLSWLAGKSCLRVSSFGSLKYFTSANAPLGATKRCTDGCSLIDSCPFSAVSLYVKADLEQWPARDVAITHTEEEHLHAVRSGPYGLCVWHSGNDVVDHQTVMMEFDEGATATCTLSGYSFTNGRRTRVQGTLGEMLFDEAAGTISVRSFAADRNELIAIEKTSTYHPEDQTIVDEWLSSLTYSTPVTVDAMEALRTHAVVFAAEISRKEKRTVEMTEFITTSSRPLT